MKRRFLAVMLVVLMLLSAASVPVSAADAMGVSQPLIDILKDMEGFSKYPYADNGQWTVGYGTRCPDDKLSRYKSKGITEKEAEKLLQTGALYYTGHCTGAAQYDYLKTIMCDRLQPLSTGMSIEL